MVALTLLALNMLMVANLQILHLLQLESFFCPATLKVLPIAAWTFKVSRDETIGALQMARYVFLCLVLSSKFDIDAFLSFV